MVDQLHPRSRGYLIGGSIPAPGIEPAVRSILRRPKDGYGGYYMPHEEI